MQIFTSTLNQMAFLFLLILIGFLLCKLRVIGKEAAALLSKLENTVFIPALVMGTFIKNFTVSVLGTAYRLLLFSCLLLLITIPLSIWIPKLITKDAYTQKLFTYGLAFSNFGFMGNSVVNAIYPDLFWEYLVFTLPLWSMIYLWGVPVLLIPAEETEGGKQTLKGRLRAFVNPMFIGMLIGMVIGITGIPLPSFATNAMDTLGSCMSPVAMLLTGITIAGIDLKKTFTDPKLYTVSAVRLLAFPLAFILVLLLIPNLPESFTVCAVCSLAMPLGLTPIVVPAAYGKDTSAAAGTVLISHLLSCLTIPLIFRLLLGILQAG